MQVIFLVRISHSFTIKLVLPLKKRLTKRRDRPTDPIFPDQWKFNPIIFFNLEAAKRSLAANSTTIKNYATKLYATKLIKRTVHCRAKSPTPLQVQMSCSGACVFSQSNTFQVSFEERRNISEQCSSDARNVGPLTGFVFLSGNVLPSERPP